ncbi:MAG: peptidylprolyl isomerase [Clostridia bacterium]|nr:peptidylprolyl isomerase [Clostridia bacterium]
MTMKTTPKRKQPQNGHKSRRRRRGVPSALVAALLIIAVFFGGLVGFVVANKTNSYRLQLVTAQERITELENILTMMGFSEGISDPNQFVFDDSDSSDEVYDLSGETSKDSSVLWNEDGFSSSMMQMEGEDVVVAEFEGGQVMASEVIEPYNDQLATEAFGFADVAADSAATLQSVMETLVADKVCFNKAQSLGLTELNDADKAAIQASMQEYYDEQKSFYRDSVDVTGMTAEEADAAVDAFLQNDIGVTLESLVAEETENYWRTKLFDEVTKDVTVTDEEIQSAYDALLADQSQRFAEYPEDYEFAVMAGETIAYNLEGYRYVKHIMLTFDDPAVATLVEDLYYQISELDPEADMEQIAQLQEQLNAYYTDLDAKADSIVEELNAGADFEALMEKYGQDEAVKYEPVKSTGYTVSANSFNQFSSEFIEGCMMLENIGDVSVPVHSVGGVHIIKYIGDAVPGEVALENLRATLEAEVLAEKQELSYIEQEAQWIVDANAKYYPEKLQ